MNAVAKLSVIAVFGLVCVACSNPQNPQEQPQPSATPSSAPPASAIPMMAPASGTSDALPPPPPLANGPALDVIMQRPAFAQAFKDMDGSAALPAWVRHGGVSAPTERVEVDGRKMWLAQTCESEDCNGSQAFLLIDPAAHTMQGLFVQVSGSEDASVQKLTWLGKPDAAVQSFLKDRIAHD